MGTLEKLEQAEKGTICMRVNCYLCHYEHPCYLVISRPPTCSGQDISLIYTHWLHSSCSSFEWIFLVELCDYPRQLEVRCVTCTLALTVNHNEPQFQYVC